VSRTGKPIYIEPDIESIMTEHTWPYPAICPSKTPYIIIIGACKMNNRKSFLLQSDEAPKTSNSTERALKGFSYIIKGISRTVRFINHSYFLGNCLDFLGKIAYCEKDSLEKIAKPKEHGGV